MHLMEAERLAEEVELQGEKKILTIILNTLELSPELNASKSYSRVVRSREGGWLTDYCCAEDEEFKF